MQPPRSTGVLRTVAFAWLGVLAGFAIGVEWIRSRPTPPQPSGGIDLVGAGATFPYPLYRRWFADYGRRSGVRINYFSVGSTEGIRMLLAGEADFGAADRPLTAEEQARSFCGPLAIPMVAGAVAVAYRVPGLSAPLRLDADVLARIFTGRISRWDDAALVALNPGVTLPSLPIRVVQRARVTGTSALFAQYLEQSAHWRAAGSARALTSAAAQVEGNEGITAAIATQAGAIGVVEQTYAAQAGLAVAALRNASGAFVLPSATSAAAAVAELLSPTASDTALGAIGASGAAAYPAVGVTRIIADAALGDATKAAHFIAFARWALDDGARMAGELGYAALPTAVANRQRQRLAALRPGTCPTPRSP
ncbi:MAG: phosphate ABC transporter substrate-binding protein PstS [Gemmatimonadaceae bacterium]|nr:phosphate ABC transporter substrate-binding protein PstS [Gemmatimonadaceae bacterium]MCW5825705.1 phosphate ABC transporter substrate-binding protein PstS [Gemmatimonadaceae bacterium]